MPRTSFGKRDLDKKIFESENIGENLPKFRRDEITICAPIPRPGKIICIGLNYRNHAIESGMEIPKREWRCRPGRGGGPKSSEVPSVRTGPPWGEAAQRGGRGGAGPFLDAAG